MISKKQSKMIQGLSILMMIYHHLFSMPGNILYPYRSLLQFGNFNMELRLAWFCKMTIALFAFVSGYGLCTIFMQKCENVRQPSLWRLLFARYRIVISQIIKLYSKFWLVFLVFMGIFWNIWGYPFDRREYISNLLGLSTSYNGTWWYILQYVKMVMLLPLIDLLFAKINAEPEQEQKIIRMRKMQKGFLVSLFVICAGMYLWAILFKPELLKGMLRILKWFRVSYLAVFLMGYFCRRFGLFEAAYQYVSQKSKVVQFLISISLLVITVTVRVLLSDSPSYARMDFLITPFFVLGFLILISYLKWISFLLEKLGELSTFMWLTHIFYYDEIFSSVVSITGTSIGMYGILLCLSVVTAFILQNVYRFFQKWCDVL